MMSLGRQPAGGSDLWPWPRLSRRSPEDGAGMVGGDGPAIRPLAGDGASRRPKVVSNPRYHAVKFDEPQRGGRKMRVRRHLSPLRGFSNLVTASSWGSRPRLIIFRASGAFFQRHHWLRCGNASTRRVALMMMAPTAPMFPSNKKEGRGPPFSVCLSWWLAIRREAPTVRESDRHWSSWRPATR